MFIGKTTSRKGAVAVLAAAGLMLGSASAASADTTDSSPVKDVFDASAVVGEMPLAADQPEAVVGNVVVAEGSHTSVAVTLPVPANAESNVDRGVVAISANESSSIVPVKFSDGSVAIHSVLNDATAPTSYSYGFDLNAGTTLVFDERTGGVIAVNSGGGVDFLVAPPWATDANGDAVATHYTISGDSLVQHVDVDDATAFPVVADPWVGIDLVDSFTWSNISGSGWRQNVNPTPYARLQTGNLAWYQAIGEAGWSELYNKTPSTQRGRMTASGKGQYICHMGFAGTDAQWNLEMWKSVKSAAGWVASKCN